MRRRACVAIVLVIASIFWTTNLAQATYVTGKDMASWYEELQKAGSGGSMAASSLFVGYVEGVIDSFDQILFCIPDGVKVNQLVRIVGDFIKANPSEWDHTGSNLVIKVLKDKHPCPLK